MAKLEGGKKVTHQGNIEEVLRCLVEIEAKNIATGGLFSDGPLFSLQMDAVKLAGKIKNGNS